MKNQIAVFIVMAILLFGCTTPEKPKQGEKPDELSFQTSTYSDMYLSFSFPSNMTVKENFTAFRFGGGHAFVVLFDNDSIIQVAYLNVSTYNISDSDAPDVPAANLNSESTASPDPLGVLHLAQNLGEVQTGKIGVGHTAARTFYFNDGKQDVYGVALSIYNPEIKAIYSVRIYSNNQRKTLALNEAFQKSLKFYNVYTERTA